MDVVAEFQERSTRLRDRLVSLRREIHHQPEFGLHNPVTQRVILRELERIGVERVQCGRACSSVVAEVQGERNPESKSCIVLRADTDALPLSEEGSEKWASNNPALMHACGHDAHTAMLLGAAELLNRARKSFSGTVRLWFQPGEEGFAGAKVMIEEGALDGASVAFALHVQPSAPSGVIILRTGVMMASADTFGVVFSGVSGHASAPHLAKDPIPAIGPFVDGLAHVSSREIDPADPVVFTVTQITAGSNLSSIASTASCLGGFRAVSERGRRKGEELLKRVAQTSAAAKGVEVSVNVFAGYPATINHSGVADLVKQTALELGIPVEEMNAPAMTAEDFSYVLGRIPGAIAFLGCSVEGGGPLHSERMRLDENILSSGAGMLAAMGVRMLGCDLTNTPS